MTEERILIIGGGFLGCALARALSYREHHVTVLTPGVLSGRPGRSVVVSGRQEDGQLVTGLLSEHGTVIHAAWGTTPGSSAGQPVTEVAAGLAPWAAFLETLQQFPSVRLLFLSSGGTIYGEPERVPVREDFPLRPLSSHGVGKAAAELFLAAQGRARSIVLRPSNVYGPEQPWRSGFGVLRHLLQCAIQNRPFTLFGDGSHVRDYLYIDDFVDGVLRLLESSGLSGAYNIGSGTGVSLRELIALVEKVTGQSMGVEPRPARRGDVARIVLDVEKICRATRWTPTTSLEEGIARTWQWIRERA